MDDIFIQLDRSLYLRGTNELPSNATPDNIVSGSTLASLNMVGGAWMSGKTTFSNDETGFILGLDDGVSKFYIGDSTNYLNWDGSSLTIAGALSATSGMIGGFSIGANYIRDAANSFGLASTVTGGDDVRFWAGAKRLDSLSSMTLF